MVITLAACSKDNNNNNNNPTGKATFSVKMTDSPGAYDAVNIDVVAIKANYNGQWVEFPLEAPGVYNLLDFTNGNTLLLLGDTALAPGSMTEVRLLLGNNNTVVVDGVTYDLTTPSGQTSGYKVKMDSQTMVAGGMYRLVIDFDVNHSVHMTGNGKYMLKPVCRGYLEGAIGGIAGAILPINGAAFVEATNAIDTAGTIIDTVTGNFLISTVPPGTYNVTFTAKTGFRDTTIAGVAVVAGQTTQMGTVVITPLK